MLMVRSHNSVAGHRHSRGKKLGVSRRPPGWHRREQRRVITALATPDLLLHFTHHLSPLADHFAPLMDHLFLAYERVVFPCQSMNCGDAVYRR